ncbi:ArsR/SmtB family transcription factor [Acetivibrio cellulolyticus]|uniref:ArsR/SmtB family transcription factor n=1 Tax=Acetivibrio cellulolyticus TaxID=35830 RepID=UPI0001E2DE75|nr:metalloregulator ArsR/SmtB family transcription factor [Acetivibrio cellulolyticus]
MENVFVENANLFKALSDPNRLMIVDMLAKGELCACKILDEMKITQPTLSHHMKILCESGLVNGRRDGIWMRYSINRKGLEAVKVLIDTVFAGEEILKK